MAQGNVQNYQGAPDGVESIVLGGNVWIKCFNNTASTVFNNGDAVVVSGLSTNSGETAGSTYFPTIVTPATSGTPVTVLVGVVDTSVGAHGAPTGVSSTSDLTSGIGTTVPLQTWCYVLVKGYCQAVTKTTTANPVAIDDYLKAMNGVSTVATDGTSGSTSFSQKSFAVAKSVVATGVAGTVTAYLFGWPVCI